MRTGRFVRSTSCTTRPPRGKERDGVDYFYLDEPEFLRRPVRRSRPESDEGAVPSKDEPSRD